jgi:hypothetical protein
MYFWLFLNIASDDTKTLIPVLISPPEGGGGGGGGGEGKATPSHFFLKVSWASVLPVRWFFSLESKEVCR